MKSERNEDRLTWANIVGGPSPDLRRLSAQKVNDLKPDGYVLGGFGGGGGGVTSPYSDAALEITLSHLDPQKPRLMTGIVRQAVCIHTIADFYAVMAAVSDRHVEGHWIGSGPR